MPSEFIARVPISSVFYQTPILTLTNVHALVLKVLRALQSLSASPQTVIIIEDWLDHDGLEFPKGTQPFAYLFAVASTPRSLFEGTPKEDYVYLRAEANDASWILRMYTGWSAGDRAQIGALQLVVAAQFSSTIEAAFEAEMNHGDLMRYARQG